METIQFNDFNWTLYNKDNISKGILQGIHWEPHLTKFIRAFLEEGDIAVDIGACFGWHTLEMSRAVGASGKVYAFEPQKNNILLLNTNIERNGCSNVRVYGVGLGHKIMTSCICNAYFENENNFGDSFISINYERGINDIAIQENIVKGIHTLPLKKEIVSVIRLDDVSFIDTVKFMKIDVQGFEKMVIEGSVNTIRTHRPVFVIELEDPCMNIFGYSSKQLIPYIMSLDYKLYFLEYEYPCDHVCVPTEKVEDFEKKFKGKIMPHTHNNSLNNNVINGVTQKIVL